MVQGVYPGSCHHPTQHQYGMEIIVNSINTSVDITMNCEKLEEVTIFKYLRAPSPSKVSVPLKSE
ncbi:hypothetical protein DPMN_093881 [Dreissena polymorpha]|uniref:Uncharacterized protein n=1 Tax=Dreissena polymorpha TaxID=45954 RepID=A0A9D4R2Z9_DREPO|nr:hypothetical protein DPMN_093881 [Dreissena polymorpha]